MIRPADIPTILIERIEASHPDNANFQADEIAAWPEGMLPILLKHGLLAPASRAKVILCNGCEEACRKLAIYRRGDAGRPDHAFISCDEAPALGRIPVDLDQLRRYRATLLALAQFIAAALGIERQKVTLQGSQATIGRIQGRYGIRLVSLQLVDGLAEIRVGSQSTPVARAFDWQNGEPRFDVALTRRMANRKEPTPRSRSTYQPDRSLQTIRSRKTQARDNRIWKEARLLLGNGVPATEAAKRIADMDFLKSGDLRSRPISVARVRRIIAEKKSKAK